MAESSKSGGLGKQLFGAKNELGRESKRKRKRGKKPVRTQSKETLESELKYQGCSTLVCDEQNVVDNDEDSKMNLEQESQTVVSNDERETANVSEEVNSQDNEMATVKAKQGTKINEECMNKDGQQDPATIEEQRSEEQGSKPESVKQDQVSSNEKRKLSIRRNKKVKLSKGKSPFNEGKRDESLTREAAAVDSKKAEENARETCEKQVDDAAKFEASAGRPDNENNDASKSPEGTQEKSLSKSNKGKKLKQLASFGRNKKKPEIAVKLEESSNERHESLGDSPERSERSASTTSQDFLNAEIVDSVLKEPVATDKSDFSEELEHCNDGRDEGTEFVEKEAAKQKKKKKGSVLGFKRSKSNLGKRKSSKNEEQDTESSPNEKTSARKESDVSTVERDLVEKKEDEFEEIKLDPKASKMKAADLKTEDISGAAPEMTQEVSYKEETNSAESKETGATVHEASSQVTPKKEKKENILRRSLRKFKSQSKALQERKKSQNDENSAEVAEDGAKMMDLTEKRGSCDLEQTTEEQKPAIEEKDEDEEQCLDHEGSSKAAKRKKSDMKNATRAMKRKKEGGESLKDIQEKDELSETAVIEETQDQKTFEESSALKDMENKKELEYLTEVEEKSVDEFNFQVNKELSQQKNDLEEHEERRQSDAEEEISRESVTREDTQTEEQITKEAHEIWHTVIHELIELIEKKEAKKAEENATQVEEKEGSVNFSDEENVVAESQQQTSAIDDAELECDGGPEDEVVESWVVQETESSTPAETCPTQDDKKTDPGNEVQDDSSVKTIIPKPEGPKDEDEKIVSSTAILWDAFTHLKQLVLNNEKLVHVDAESSSSHYEICLYAYDFSLAKLKLIALWSFLLTRVSEASKKILVYCISSLIKKYPHCFKIQLKKKIQRRNKGTPKTDSISNN